MSATFRQNEIKYLTAWAIEDHLGKKDAAARTLQRDNSVHSAVLGSLVARLVLSLKINELDMVGGPYPEGSINWPWPAKNEFETRVQELLPKSSISYLEQLGALEKCCPKAAVIQPRG